MFAGSILIDTRNGNALMTMTNTAELYGRTRTIDVHREVFGKKNDCDLPTSLPSPFKKTPHQRLALNCPPQRRRKLVIGTQTCNILITFGFQGHTTRWPFHTSVSVGQADCFGDAYLFGFRICTGCNLIGQKPRRLNKLLEVGALFFFTIMAPMDLD
ncbi:unnamed protein product [Absidia cylindrospora]